MTQGGYVVEGIVLQAYAGSLPAVERTVTMDGIVLVVMGVFVLLNWLHVAFFDRIQNWRTPWDRWARVRTDVNWMMKALAIAFAGLVTLIYILMLALAAAG